MTLMLETALELGLVYGLVAIGIFLSFRIVNFPDLTVDGTFVLGAAISATLIVSGTNPFIATLAGALAGALAGCVTAYLHTHWKVLDLLAGILTMTALYSINLRIMGKPNVAMLEMPSIFDGQSHLIIIALFVATLMILLDLFLRSEIGLALRATGANPRVASAQGVSVSKMKILALMLSNALIALAGALFAQSEGFADISLGTGTLIVGLAALMIGEALFHSRRMWVALLACVAGSVIYRLAVGFALDTHFAGLKATDLNLITALLVTVALIVPRFRKGLGIKGRT